MLKFLSKIFDENKRALTGFDKIVKEINDLESEIEKLSDVKLKAQTEKFKKEIKNEMKGVDRSDQELVKQKEQEVLDKILPEVFATVREVSKRVIGLRHFDVQLVAGIALHKGYVTEQKTGEGKTLTVTAPLYLNALIGKGVHLITVNDYLAEIGVGWMGPIYEFLGLSCAVAIHDRSKIYDSSVDSEDRGDERLEHFVRVTRREAYAADITYGTNNEFGFDYLRDNMAPSLARMAQRPASAHYFTIVDEADSILIDEARTPLIISAPESDATDKYYRFAKMVQSLTKDQDYTLDEKARSVTLTDLGVKRLEKKLGVSNLYEENFDTIHHVETALKAQSLYHRDKEYIVREKKVIIVDDHTGRLMFGRRYGDGLHQAIEAKEAVPIQKESKTLATISIQNYFRLYSKLAGMSGTAVTEAEEFKQIYDCDVLAIPTNVPVVRTDYPDVVYKTTAAKYSAIVREVEEIHKAGAPILIGTRSIENNQIIAKFLSRKRISHEILNAKNHEREAFVIADAGKKGAITVATNIAGRGVDIVLGGAKPEIKDYRKKKKGRSKKEEKIKNINVPPGIDPAKYDLQGYAKALENWQQSHDEVVECGGLHIIGTERHESRRIDNQLRGRSGRQGDPGASRFFVGLDDEIMRIFGGEQIRKMMDFLKIDENMPIEHKMISKSIESAQVKVEGYFFDQRKRLVEFDDVMNKHREIIYRRRRRLLEQSQMIEQYLGEDVLDSGKIDDEESLLKEQVLSFIDDDLKNIVGLHAGEEMDENDLNAIMKEFVGIIPFDKKSQHALVNKLKKQSDPEAITEELMTVVKKTYEAREKEMGSEKMRFIERFTMLSSLDEKWIDHLDEMASLKEGIWLRGDKQTVLSEYKKESFDMFQRLVGIIESAVSRKIFRIHIGDQRAAKAPQKIKLQKDDIHESLEKEVADASVPKPAAVRSTKGSGSDFASVLAQAKGGSSSKPGIKKARIGRNDPCPCGSGKKYKKCCFLKE